MTFSQIAAAYRSDRSALIVALQAVAAADYITPASAYLADRFAIKAAPSAAATAASSALFADLFAA